MNINILRYSHFGIAEGSVVDHTFVKFIIYPLTMIVFILLYLHEYFSQFQAQFCVI